LKSSFSQLGLLPTSKEEKRPQCPQATSYSLLPIFTRGENES